MDFIHWAVNQSGSLYLVLELTAALAIVLVSLCRPQWGSAAFARVERAFSGLAHSPVRQIAVVGLLAVGARAAVLPWLGAPAAAFHDEQSLLLQAQTFLAGRLANPTHPFWEHFETFHVNQVPAYASMYFPGRGAPLALGLLVADHAWVGVWISFVLMAMAAVWMLQGWVSLPLAFLGGVLVVLRLGTLSYWINSYWGGAFAAFGAMLVVGALPRLLAHPRWRDGTLMGLGAAILMTTRPYEGALLCVAVGVALIAALVRLRWTAALATLVRSGIPVAAFVAAGGALLLVNNAATTGDPLRSPYDLNRQTYAVAPAFLTSPPIQSAQRGPAYFRQLYQVEAENYERRNSLGGIARSAAGKFLHTFNFYLGAPLGIAFLTGLYASRREYFLLGGTAFFMAGYLLETWNFPHYSSPVFPLLLILTMRGFAWLRTRTWRNLPVGLSVTRAVPTAVALVAMLPVAALVLGLRTFDTGINTYACCSMQVRNARSDASDVVRSAPGRHLVLVRDTAANPLHLEMVYNEPDIDDAKVVWARRLSPERDRLLLTHFHDRVVWEFEWLPAPGPAYRLQRLAERGPTAQPVAQAAGAGSRYTDEGTPRNTSSSRSRRADAE